MSPPSRPQAAARESLTAAEADTLEAIVARVIPADEYGPGAAEAGAAINDYGMANMGAAFAELPAANQDAILTA